uniref:metallophosphoesterase n=1 Tax=Nocardia flavorosea TaxID=53429 RepID=UPI002457A695
MPVISTSALRRTAFGAAGAAAAGVGYASLIERNAFVLREATMPVLRPGSAPLRILHISDLHMTPGQKLKQQWLRELDRLEPDLVINTGDNLSHQKAVPAVVQSLGPLLSRPGLFVFGSNDYFAPVPKNPLKYFDKNHKRVHGAPLPWKDLRAAVTESGWVGLTPNRRDIEVGGLRIASAGVGGPHIQRDPDATVK